MIPSDIKQLFVDHGAPMTLAPGDVLFRQGDASDAVYLLKSGSLNVSIARDDADPVIVNIVEAGELVGELGAITQHPRTATVIAASPVALSCIPSPQFRALLATNLSLVETMTLSNREHLISADTARIHFESSYDQMQKRVASLGEEKEQLKELLHLREELEAMVVHDLRNPLSNIVIALSLLEPLKEQVSDPEGFQVLTRLATSGAQRMLNLISSLLDIARLESGRLVLNIREFDLSTMIAETVATQQVAAKIRSVEIVTRVAPGLMIRADRDLLVRVMSNLMDNALKFAPRMSNIEIAANVLDNRDVCMTCTDAGPGIPQEERERIFEKFTRVQDAEHQKRTGTGLGLTFCRMAVEAHGGTIRVDDGPSGAGSCFTVQIPQV